MVHAAPQWLMNDGLQTLVEGGGGFLHIIQTRPEFAIEYFSDEISSLTGYPRQRFVEDPELVWSVIHENDAEALRVALTLAPGEHSQVEVRWVHRNGSTRWLRHHLQAVTRADGTRALYGLAFDVSDLHTALDHERASVAQYRLLAENASDFVVMFSPEGTIRWVSSSIETALGWKPDDVIERGLHDFESPQSRSAEQRTIDASYVGRESSDRCLLQAADGSHRWFTRTIRGLRDEAGRLTGWTAGFHDITGEVATEEALARREREVRDVAEHSTDFVLRTTPDAVINWVSMSAQHVLGWRPEEMIGRTIFDFIQERDYADVHRTSDQVNLGKTTHNRRQVRRRDGSWLWVDVITTPVLDTSGHVVSRVSGCRDISAEVDFEQRLTESERRYRLLAENSSDLIFLGDRNAVLTWVSPSVEDLHGWRAEDLVGRSVTELLHPQDVPRLRDASDLANSGVRAEYEARVRRADGRYQWMAVTLRPFVDDDGTVLGRVASARDIESERTTRIELARSEERFRTALESAPAGMAVLAPDRQFLEVNPALCRLLGRDPDWLTAHRLGDVLDPNDNALDQRMRDELLTDSEGSLTCEHQVVRSDGQRRWVQHSIGVIRDPAGTVTSYVSQFVDVTDARQAREQLRFLASHDGLTGLMNRRELFTQVSATLSNASQSPGRLAVMFIDLDGLKPINDTYGHVVGDEVIRTVADRIQAEIRSEDLVARYGGDEFVVVMPGVSSIDDALNTADCIHKAIGEPLTVASRTIMTTVSIGLALAGTGEQPDDLFSRADAALYQAKRQGKHRTFADPQV